MDTSTLLAWVIFWAFWMWYFAYWKSTANYISLISWIVLMVFPYFVSNIYALLGIWIFFIILPFFVKW